jgi:hypothetical protein
VLNASPALNALCAALRYPDGDDGGDQFHAARAIADAAKERDFTRVSLLCAAFTATAVAASTTKISATVRL